MTIEVKYRAIVEQPVRVLVDGLCNHGGERDLFTVETEMGYERKVITCSDCNAEYNDLDDRWIV